jgi:uncharacterized protein (TIGR00290 family)
MRERVLFTWSGGKDSAMALYELQRSQSYEIAALLTTVTGDFDRISMHGVRYALLETQAESLGIPLERVLISKSSSNEEYESSMREVLERYKGDGIGSVVFGDIFLEDVRQYREDNLSKIGMEGIFPLWGRDTLELAHTFIGAEFKSIITCVDSNALAKRFIGRLYDERLLSELPAHIDPCGEHGEFHTFVFDGPLFNEAVAFRRGRIVLRDERFYFCDLIPSG